MAGATPGPVGASLAARECILDTLSGSSAHGVRGVGVDTVVAASGVAKATLYKHFPRKDDLVLSYLEKAELAWRDQLRRLRLPVTTRVTGSSACSMRPLRAALQRSVNRLVSRHR